MPRTYSQLSQAELPIRPQTAQQLRRLLKLASTRNHHLQDVVLNDPAAAIALFRELGRARPGAHERVTDVVHALSMIGLDTFRRLLCQLPEARAADKSAKPSNDAASAYSQAAHAAYYAGMLAEHRGLKSSQEIPTAALVQNPAVLALWALDPEAAQRATYAMRDGVGAELAFGAELGEPLAAANQRLASAWTLPQLAQQSLSGQPGANPRPAVVQLADGLARSTAAGWQYLDEYDFVDGLAEFLDVGRDEAASRLHQWASGAARHLSALDYPLPGFELMFMPGELEEDDDEDIPLMGSWRAEKSPPTKAAPKPASDLHATMAKVMRRIRQDAGAKRVMFAMLNKDRSRLRTRLALGGDKSDPLRKLDLALNQKNLFTALMGKSQSVWLNPQNAAKYRPYLPDSLRRMLSPDGAFTMSLFVRGRPLGLMYGDGDTLDEQGYRKFRALCQEAVNALGGGTAD